MAAEAAGYKADSPPQAGAPPKTKLNYMKPDATWTRFLGPPKMQLNILQPLRQVKAYVGIGMQTQENEVELLDARTAGLGYQNVGFTLEPFTTTVADADWASVANDGSAANELYKKELEVAVRKLHPTVVKIEWSTFLLRGSGANPPASGGIHLDYFPDREKMDEFFQRYKVKSGDKPFYNDFFQTIDKHPDLELELVLGLWKPRNTRDPVCESPLIACDPRTVNIQDAIPQEQEFTVLAEGREAPIANMSANLRYSDKHKWYYYPEQTKDELFVFRHYTAKDLAFANFHCAGVLPLPEGREPRSSVETRAFLFFEKDTK